MKENKNPLVLYDSQLKTFLNMPREKAGKLIQSIILHKVGQDLPPEDDDLKYIYMQITEQMDIDALKYMERCQINQENGRQGGAPKGNQNARKQPKQPSD